MSDDARNSPFLIEAKEYFLKRFGPRPSVDVEYYSTQSNVAGDYDERLSFFLHGVLWLLKKELNQKDTAEQLAKLISKRGSDG